MIDFNLPSARVRAVSIRNIALFYLLSALFPCLLPSLLGQQPMRAVKAEQSALQFEPNLGQDKSSARYISYGDGYVLRLGPASATVALHHAPVESAAASTDNSLSNAIELKFVGGNLDSSIVGESEAISRHSYFPSSDPKSWVRSVPAYERVRYSDIYKGIDLAFYGNNQRLEYDLLLKPEADPGQILFSADGAKQVELDKQGNLVISHQGVRFTLLKPFAYQSASAGKPRPKVDIDYEIHRAGPHAQPIIGFHLGHYDRKQSLVIDPVLIYGTYIPAASGYSYPPYYYSDTTIDAMTADAKGNTYVVAGVSTSNASVNLMKFDPTGKLLFDVSLGSEDVSVNPAAVALDTAGDIYIAGSAAPGLPTTSGAFQQTATNDSAYLAVIKYDATSLIYASYLGGNSETSLGGLAVDSSGNAYLTGNTNASNFPTTQGVYLSSLPDSPYETEYLAKLNPHLSGTASLQFSTFLAANNTQQGLANGVAVDSAGSTYVISDAGSYFPVTQGAYSFEGVDSAGAYITKLDPTASTLIYSAYLGPGNPTSIAVDGSHEVYVTGAVSSAEFPVTAGAYQTNYPGGFAAKLSSDGSTLVYSTFLAEPLNYSNYSVSPSRLAIAPGCVSTCPVYIAGTTDTSNFPLINALQNFPGQYSIPPQPAQGFNQGFLVNLAADGKSALYSTYLGAETSPTYSVAGVAVDSSGNVYFASNIDGDDAPASAPAVLYPGQGFLASIGPQNAGALVATPSTITFNTNQPVNSVVVQSSAVQLRNLGTESVTLQRPFVFSSKEFAETDNCGSVLAAGSICTLNVSFRPQATGQRSATLSIGSNSKNSPALVTLSGYGIDAPNLTYSSMALNFADQVVASASSAQIITVSNTGDVPAAFQYSLYSTPIDYPVTNNCPAQIAPGASCKVSVAFVPSQIGLRSGSLYFYGNNISGVAVSLTGTGVLNAAGTGTIVVSPSSINYGSLLTKGGTSAQVITVTNTGDAPVSINAIAVATNANQGASGDFSILTVPSYGYTYSCGSEPYGNTSPPVFPTQLAPQSSCLIEVAYTPSVAGQEAGTVTITDSASGSPHQVGLSGIGLQSVQPLTVEPSTIAFPAQPVGEASAAQTFIITNGGEDSVLIDRAATSGDFAINETSNVTSCEGAILGPGNSCNVAVSFLPTAIGNRVGTLTITDAVSGTPQVFNLTGVAIQATGTLVLGQSSITFPPQTNGSTSPNQELFVSNPGNTPVTINSAVASGDFAVTSQQTGYNAECGGPLAPDSTCLITVAFSPTKPSGPESGTLTLHTTTGNLTAALSGTSVEGPQALQTTPTHIQLGTVQVGKTSDQSSFEPILYIENTGGQPVTFPNPVVLNSVGSAPLSDFTYYSSCGQYIPYSAGQQGTVPMPPGQTCYFTFVFKPSLATAEQAIFTLVDSAGTQSVSLNGQGVSAVPAVVVQPALLAFNEVAVGATSSNGYTSEIELQNNEAQPLTIASVSVTAGSSDFSISSQYGSCVGVTIEAGNGCSTVVNFSPAAPGYRTGTVTIKDTNGHTYTAGLAGYGIPGVSQAALSPQSLVFPSVAVQTPAAYSPNPPALLLNNNGNLPFTVGSIQISTAGDFSLPVYNGDYCSGTTVQAGSACSVSLQFSPLAVGTRTGSVSFPVTYKNGTTATLKASLSGTGLAEVASANLLPQNAYFPSQVISTNNYSYQSQTVFIFKNTGTVSVVAGSLTGTNIIRSGTTGGDFLIAYDECSQQTIPPAGSCNITVQFSPLAAGNRTGSITLPVTYAGGTVASFTSTVNGTGLAPSPGLQLNTQGLQFNVEVVGTTDSTNVQTVSLTSNGNTAATIRSVSISPNFTIVSNYCNTNLTPGSTCMMTIAFTPLASTAPGNVSGTLTIVDTAPGSPRIVHLSGTAVAAGQQLALSQTSVAFNSQPVQTSSPAQVVYLVDLGPPSTSAPRVQINSIVLGGANPADFTMTENCGGTLGFTIGGRQSCMISVAFSPAAKSTGSRSANVTITPASSSPLVIQLSGTVK